MGVLKLEANVQNVRRSRQIAPKVKMKNKFRRSAWAGLTPHCQAASHGNLLSDHYLAEQI
jgi:hypothetical protein